MCVENTVVWVVCGYVCGGGGVENTVWGGGVRGSWYSRAGRSENTVVGRGARKL